MRRLLVILMIVAANLCEGKHPRPTDKQIEECKKDWYNTEKYPKHVPTPQQSKYFHVNCSWPDGVQPKASDTLYRQECRTLSKSQRQALFRAIGKMMSTHIDGMSEYHNFVVKHRSGESPGAHFGSGFCGWHREYLTRFERALRHHEPDAVLCYIDWRLEGCIANPLHSAMWVDDYFGTLEGEVRNGFGGIFAKGWPVLKECKQYGNFLTRHGTNQGELYSYETSDYVKNCRSFTKLSLPWATTFEYAHGVVHNSVGGHMSPLSCSPTDPIFFLHHCFVDYMYQTYRDANPKTKASDYPTGSDIEPPHRASAQMIPFLGKQQKAGHSNIYETYYKYVPSPRYCKKDSNCKSDILWCNNGNCCAKIRIGGDCASLPHQACYDPKSPSNNGRCSGGRCRPGSGGGGGRGGDDSDSDSSASN